MTKNHSFKSSLLRYLAIVGVYLVCLVTLKIVEFVALGIAVPDSRPIWINAIVYNLIVTSWMALGIGVLYLLIRLLSQKTAVVMAAVVYALLLLTEVGLTLYVSHNGYLLGCELVARPLGESLMAVRGAMGIVTPLIIVLLLTGGFVAIALWRAKNPTRASWAAAAVMGLTMMLSLIFRVSHLQVEGFDHYILNKTLFMAADCREYFYRSLHQMGEENLVEYDEDKIADLIATHPEWGTPPDPRYPLERNTPADTFLSPYFVNSGTGKATPNIVIILVESLGAELMGSGAMPFVDSLAATGLYWRNCLSTTTRSYGAIPGITGSVGGPKCFQFGVMPDHNSLFSLLKNAGYSTRTYYAGDFNFDCIYEYLSAQHTDYLSPLYEEFVTSPAHQSANNWGYNDDILFSRTLMDLENYSHQMSSVPHISLVTTITMHEELNLTDKAKQHEYEQRASRLPLPPSGAKLAALFPACLYTDDCLRNFIHDFSRLPGYENTLFVITGDHSTCRQKGDKLSYHHVPLILWSPLVRHPATFTHVVTHNDVAPSLYSLLTSRYGLPAYPTVHWLGDGLGPTHKTLLVVNYVLATQDIIFHNYYYQSDGNFASEKLYTFGSDLLLHPCSNPQSLDSCRRQLELMRYLYSYTYLTNHLTAHPINTRQYTTPHIFLPPDFVFVTPDTSSCPDSYLEYNVFPSKQFRMKPGYRFVRVTLEADAAVKGNPSMEQYPDLFIYFTGDIKQQYGEPLCKLFSKRNHISVIKEFPISEKQINYSLRVTMRTPYSKENWLPESSITLTNIQITLKYGK